MLCSDAWWGAMRSCVLQCVVQYYVLLCYASLYYAVLRIAVWGGAGAVLSISELNSVSWCSAIE